MNERLRTNSLANRTVTINVLDDMAAMLFTAPITGESLWSLAAFELND